MADYSSLTKKELLYTLLARDLMLEERRKENDLQKATINTLIVDHKASKEWYKMQIADTEAQNKRVLEKLDIIVRSNQELEKQHDIDNQVIQLMEDNREKDKISFAVEQLEKVKEYIKTNLMSFQKVPIIQEIDNQIKQLKEGK